MNRVLRPFVYDPLVEWTRPARAQQLPGASAAARAQSTRADPKAPSSSRKVEPEGEIVNEKVRLLYTISIKFFLFLFFLMKISVDILRI